MPLDGFLNIAHNHAGELQFVIMDWVKSTAQGTPVVGHVSGTGLGAQNDTDQTEVVYPAPHSQQQISITELATTFFIVRFWRSSDGVTKDTLLLELAGNARTGVVGPLTRYEYVVDRGESEAGVWADPVQGDTGVGDTRLQGKNYWIQERGTGDLLAAEITDRVAGGFDFATSGKIMNSGGVYIAYVMNLVDAEGDDLAAIATSEDIFVLEDDADFNPLTMGGRTIVVDSPDEVVTLTFANLLLLADTKFNIVTHYGSQRNVVLQLDTGDTVKFMRQDVNKIVLGIAEDLEIIVRDNVMYARAKETGHNDLGEVIWSYRDTILNTLKADGTLYSGELPDYPRVEELLDMLPAGSVVNETTWQTITDGKQVNKYKWMRDGDNFRPPDLRDVMLKGMSALDGSIVAGRRENSQLPEHYHFIATGGDGAGDYLSQNHGAGGNSSYQFNSSPTAPTTYRTSSVGSGTENLVTNAGLYPLICI